MKYLNTLHGRVELFGFFWFSRIHRVRKLGLDNAGTDLRNPDVVRPERANLEKKQEHFLFNDQLQSQVIRQNQMKLDRNYYTKCQK
jgi:hypothetical protein